MSPSSTISPGRAPTRTSRGCATAPPSISSMSTCAIARRSTASWPTGRFDAVIHLAAQVAVTTSVTDPGTDFAVNAIGTFNMLDAVRLHCPGGGLHLRLDQQGLRQDRRRGERAARQPVRVSRSAARHRRNRAARFSFALRLLQGRCGSVRARLRENLPDPRHVVPAVVHLRAAPVRRGGPGLGRLVRDRVDCSAATSPSSATASRCATCCTSTISCAPTRRPSARRTR